MICAAMTSASFLLNLILSCVPNITSKIDEYTTAGQPDPEASLTTAGYSSLAIFIAMATGAMSVLAVNLNGFRRFDAGIPLVGSSSAAISAACHRPGGDDGAAEKVVRRGVIETGKEFGFEQH